MEIELPNGQIAEFPDDMPHEQIESVLQNHFKAAPEDKNNAFEMIKSRFPGMPESMIRGLMPLAIEEAEHPVNPNKSSALGTFGRSAVRSPLEGAENLASLVGLPTVKNSRFPGLIAEREADKQHQIANIGGALTGFALPAGGSIAALRSIPAWGKLAEKSAGSFLRRAPIYGAEGATLGSGYAPEGQRAENALIGAGLGIGGALIPSIGKGFKNLRERYKSLKDLDRLKEEGTISNDEYQLAINDEDALKDLMQRKGLETNASELEAQKPELKQKEQNLSEEINTIPEVPTENMLPPAKGENLIPESENLLREKQGILGEQEKEINKYLDEGLSHDVRAAKAIDQSVKDTKKFIQNNYYKQVDKNLEDKNIVIPRTAELKQIESSIREQLESSKAHLTEEQFEKSVQSYLNAYAKSIKPANDIIPAKSVVAQWKTVRDLANEARLNSRKEGILANDRIEWEKRAENLSLEAEKLNDIIKNNIGDDYNLLSEGNRLWRENITPLYKNPLYWEIAKKKRINGNMIQKLRGEESGQDILRNLIKQNPETLRNVVGQSYAGKPHNLHVFNEEAEQYIKELPQLLGMRQRHKIKLEAVNAHEQGVNNAKNKVEQLKAEESRINKSYTETKKQQEIRNKLVSERKEIQSKIADIDTYLPELKKKAAKTNISLKQKMELEAKISKTEKDKEKLKNRLLFIAASTLIGTTTYKLGKILK